MGISIDLLQAHITKHGAGVHITSHYGCCIKQDVVHREACVQSRSSKEQK